MKVCHRECLYPFKISEFHFLEHDTYNVQNSYINSLQSITSCDIVFVPVTDDSYCKFRYCLNIPVHDANIR